MIERTKGWDTIGVTGVGVLDDGCLKMEFTGRDKSKRNVFVPLSSLGGLFATIIALLKDLDERGVITSNVGEELAQKSQLILSKYFVGVDETGKNYTLQLVTGDNLSFQFLMPVNAAQALCELLVATLSEHGRLVDLPKPGSTQH